MENGTQTNSPEIRQSSCDHETVLFVTLNQHQLTLLNFVFFLVQLIVAGVALLLNGVVVDTMVRRDQSKEPADVLVTGLAVTDILTAIVIIYNVVYGVAYYQHQMECLFRYSLVHALLAVSAYFLLCLTIDRYLKIVVPYRYNAVCSKWSLRAALVLAATLGTVVGLLPVFGWHQSQDVDDSNWTTTGNCEDGERTTCSYFGVMDDDYLRFYMVLVNVPVLAMAALYFKLYLVSRKHALAIASQVLALRQSRLSLTGHTWRYTKTAFTVVGVYFLCWMPIGAVVVFEVSGLLDNYSNFRKGDFVLYSSSTIFINCMINPIIYAFKLAPIRQRFRHVFSKAACCCRPCLKNRTASV